MRRAWIGYALFSKKHHLIKLELSFVIHNVIIDKHFLCLSNIFFALLHIGINITILSSGPLAKSGSQPFQSHMKNPHRAASGYSVPAILNNAQERFILHSAM